MNVSEFVDDLGVGMKTSAWLFVPPQCANDAVPEQETCKLLILPGGCDAFLGMPPLEGSDAAFAQYGATNNIVILKPCQGGPVDAKRFPYNHENIRGMVDVVGYEPFVICVM